MKWFWVSGFVLAFLGYMIWRFGCAEVFSPAMLARLKPGMTTNEVVAILGPPSSVRNGEWVYLRAPLLLLSRFDFRGRLGAGSAGHILMALG